MSEQRATEHPKTKVLAWILFVLGVVYLPADLLGIADWVSDRSWVLGWLRETSSAWVSPVLMVAGALLFIGAIVYEKRTFKGPLSLNNGRRRLSMLLGIGGEISWEISMSALQTTKENQQLKRVSFGKKGEFRKKAEAAQEERWVYLESAIEEWETETGELVELLYGYDERALFESTAPLPIQEPARFDTRLAPREADLYAELDKYLYRLHEILERHQGDTNG